MARKRPPEAPAESKPKTRGKPVPTGPSRPSAPTAPPPAPKRNRRASVPPPLAPQLAGLNAEDFLLTDEQKAELARWEQSEYATIMERRAKVSRYRAQKLSYREIAHALGVGIGTIFRDIKALDAVWLRSAQGERDEHRARELAELQAMERQVATAYGSSQSEDAKIRWMAERLRIKARIAALLGLDAPRTFTGEIEVKDGGLSSQERRALAAEIMAGHAGAEGRDADGDE